MINIFFEQKFAKLTTTHLKLMVNEWGLWSFDFPRSFSLFSIISRCLVNRKFKDPNLLALTAMDPVTLNLLQKYKEQ